MAKIDSRFIRNLFAPFAPSIREGQVITAYVGEDITPYIIQGDNFSTTQGMFQLLSEKIDNSDISSS